jgi:glycine C-acetyltransferase
MGARMMSGNTDEHEEFERQLAEFVGKEDSFLLNYGYQGIMSIIECMVDHRDIIVYDAESHACIIDGIRLHKAKMGDYYKFNHNDMDSLRKNLDRATKRTQETGGGILVITEGVFGMSGNAHGFGTMGANGRGVGEHLNCTEGIDLYFSTFAKSMAAIGAFVAAPKDIIMYLKYNMRSQTYAKALPMPFVIGGMKRLELIKKHPELRDQLWANVKALQKGLIEKGFDIGETTSPVTPVFLHGDYDIAAVTSLVRDLRENMGIFCSIVVYPVVPKGQIMLRIIPTSSHTLADINYTTTCFAEVQKRLQAGYYRDLN